MTICILPTSSRRLFIDLHRVRSIIFRFYSNEHEPIHVHVKHGECESIFELIMKNGALSNINIREKHGVPPLSTKDKHVAESFIRKYSKNIIDKWVRFFVMAGEKHQHQDKNMSERLYITDAYDVGGLRVPTSVAACWPPGGTTTRRYGSTCPPQAPT